MRMTVHNGRAGKNGVYSPKHNDRQFDISSAEHIDPERMPGNVYWNWTGKNISFEDAEKEFYELHCREHLDAVNQRHREQRHPERVRDMDAYRTARQTCPEETLLMIGNKDEHLPPKTLRAICEELRGWEEKQIPGLKVLDMALHVDEEGAPHIHMRRAWIYRDENNVESIAQSKALQQEDKNRSLQAAESEIRGKMEREQTTARQLAEMNQKARQTLREMQKQLEVLTKAEQKQLEEQQKQLEREWDEPERD